MEDNPELERYLDQYIRDNLSISLDSQWAFMDKRLTVKLSLKGTVIAEESISIEELKGD